MDTMVMSDSERFALELHGLIGDLDPARWQRQVRARLRGRLETARDHAEQLAARFDEDTASVRTALDNIHEVLSSALPAADAPARAWGPFRKNLSAAYEELCRDLADHAVEVPNLRPTNHTRSLMHAFMATLAILVLWAFEDRTWLIAGMVPWLGFAIITETLRKRSPEFNERIMRIFAPVAHPHEHHSVNSGTWYAAALFILAVVDVDPASGIALAALGFGDPMAAFVGRRWGRTTLMNGRTLEGSLAFIAAGTLAGFAVTQLLYSSIPWMVAGTAALAGSTAGAVAEVVSRRVDDNFSIPVGAAAATIPVLWALGALS